MNDEKEKIEVDIQYKLKGDLNIQEEIPVGIPEVIDEENSPSVDYGDYESSSNNGVVDNTSNNDIVENSSDNEMENESTSSDDLNGELDEDSNNAEDTSNDQDNNEDTSNDQDNNEDTSNDRDYNEDTSNDQDYNEDTSNDRNSIEDTSNDRNSNVDASNDQYTLINTYYNNDVSESPNRNKYSNEENYNEVSNLYQTASNKPNEENPDNHNNNNNKQDDNQYNRENYYPDKGENNNQYNRQNNVNNYNNNDTINNSFNNVVAYKKINNNGGYNKILVNKLGINNNSNYETDIPVDISGAIEVEDSSSINYESSLDKGAVDNKSINGTVEIEDSSSNEMEIEIESTSSDETDQTSNGELEEDSNNTEDTSNNQNGSEDTSSNQSSEDTSSDQSSEDTSSDQSSEDTSTDQSSEDTSSDQSSSEDTSSDQSSSEDTIPDNEHQNTPNNNNDGNESSNENKDPNEGNNNEDPNQNQTPSNKPKEENSDNNHNNHEQNDNQDKGNNHDPNNGQNNVNNHNHNNNNNNANNPNGLNRGPHNNNKNNNSAINNAAAHKQGGSDGGAGKTLGDKLGSNKKGSFSDRMKDRFNKKKKDKDKDKDDNDNNDDDDDSNEKSKRKIALALKIKIIIVLVIILAIAALLIILIAAIVSLFSWLIGLFHLFDDPGSGTDTPAIVETSPIYQDYKLFEDSVVEAIEKYQSSCGVAIDKYYIIGTLTYKYTDELEALSDGSAYREMAKYANTVADLMVSDCVVDLAEDGLYYNKLLQSSFFSSYFKKQIELAGGDKNIVLDAIFEYIDSGKEAKKFMRGSLDINLPVNLLSCADDATSTKKLNEGRGYESTVDLSYYMEGVIFGEVGGHIEEKNKEGLKALIVAATTFVLKRNNYNSNTTELTIRSGDCNQVYCDPEIGCNYVSKDNGKYGTGYTGTQGSGSVHKPISSQKLAILEEAMDEVFGTVMLDSSGSLMSIQYRDKMSTCGTTSNCLGQIEAFNYSQQGMGYEQILQKFYTGFQLSEVVGDYTEGVQYGEGKFQTIGGFKYYNQGDYHQKFCGRSGATISGSGCGVTSMAMVIANMVDPSITPVQTMNEAHSMGYCGPGISGTSAGYFKKAAAKRGLSYNAVSRGGNTQSVINALKSGNSLVIAHMGPGMWTSGGHYIVLAGVNSKGQVLVYDPASRNKTGKYYDFNSKIVSQLKGQLHIITKK